jgi:hypothetical protein
MCGLAIIDDIGIIFSIIGDGDFNGSDFFSAISGLVAFFNEDTD